MRSNSTEAASTPTGDGVPSPSLSSLREVTHNGTDYLVADVVAQQEGVYGYPDPAGGIRYEYVSGDALTTNADDWEGTPLVLRHPKEGSDYVPVDDASDPNIIGEYRNVDPTQNGTALGGEVWIEADAVGDHGGDLRAYVDTLESGGYGEVSTGYEAGDVAREPGTYNGESYEYVQRDLSPDHLALLPDDRGNCSVAEGCGVGRANSAPDGSGGFRTLSSRLHAADVRVGDKVVWGGDGETMYGIVRNLRQSKDVDGDELDTPTVADVERYRPADEVDAGGQSTRNGWTKTGSHADADPETLQRVDAFPQPGRVNSDDGWFSWLGRRVAQVRNLSPDMHPRPGDGDDGESSDAASQTETDTDADGDESGVAEPAESGRDTADQTDTESDESDANTMEDEDKIDLLVNEYGLDRENIEPLAGTECLGDIHERFVENDAGTDDEPDGDSTDTEQKTNDGDTPSGLSDEEIDARIEAKVEERLNQEADSIADRVDEVRANERNIETVANSDTYPLERDQLESMDPASVAELADTVEETASGEDERVNMAGMPTGPSVDMTANVDETDDVTSSVGGAFTGDAASGGDD